MIYVTDLDGTLLNSHGNLTKFTIKAIKDLHSRGVKITIASARSIFTAIDFIKELNLELPVILRNGAFVYNPADESVLLKKLLNYSQMKPILDFFINEGLNPIVHHESGQKLYVDYTKIENCGENHYIQSRLNANDLRFRKVSSYKYDNSSEFISMCVIDANNKQDTVYNKAVNMFPEGYIIHKYVDTYSRHTWIEINHPDATKQSAVSYVLNHIGENEYTAFGDNINDLGMLRGAVAAYIPQKSLLDNMGFQFTKIPSIDNDGVARQLLLLNS